MNSADLILHIRDIAHPDSEAQSADVADVLDEILGDEAEGRPPVIEVWNKLDMLNTDDRGFVQAEAARRDDVILVSALTGEGVGALQALAGKRLTTSHRLRHIKVPVGDGASLAWLNAHGEVVSSKVGKSLMTVDVRLSEADYGRFRKRGVG